MRTLRNLKIGHSANGVKIHGAGVLKQRIMDMGLTPGAVIFVRKAAPLGDPIEVTVRGYELSLRKRDAEIIEIGEEDL